jgi:hypothetical protein
MSRPGLSLVGGILLAFGALASAADRFVSTQGDDALPNDCLSMSSPCRSIETALYLAESGDVLKVTRGTYDGFLFFLFAASQTVTFSGSWELDFSSRDLVTPQTKLRGFVPRAYNGNVLTATFDGFTIYGIALEAHDNSVVNLTLQNCAIRRGSESAILAVSGETAVVNVDISDSLISGNRGGLGGAVTLSAGVASTINLAMSRSTVERTRSSRGFGGAGLWTGTTGSSTISANLIDTLISRNKLGMDITGGANVTLTGSVVSRNRRGGIHTNGASVLTLTNSVIARNEAVEFSGGIHQFGPGSIDIVNSTIRENRSRCDMTGCAGGIGIGAGSADLTNAIVWGNTTPFGDAADLAIGAATVGADHSDLGDVSGSYTDGGGNISADPLCVASDDDHLTSSSPAIDTGTCTGAPATDIDGDPRPSGGGCDMGADEFVP